MASPATTAAVAAHVATIGAVPLREGKIPIQYFWCLPGSSPSQCPICGDSTGSGIFCTRYTDSRCAAGHVWHMHCDGGMKAACHTLAEAALLRPDGSCMFKCILGDGHAPGWDGRSPPDWEARSLEFIETTNDERDVRALIPCVRDGNYLRLLHAVDGATSPYSSGPPVGAKPILAAGLWKVYLYGTHTHNVSLMFRPTLNEVAQLVAASPLRAHPGPLYVVSETCNARGELTKEGTECVTPDRTRHYARTTVYCL